MDPMTTDDDLGPVIEVMRDAVLGLNGHDWHARCFTNMDAVPAALRPIVEAVSAACMVGNQARDFDPRHPQIVHWKRSALEEIDHQVTTLLEKAGMT